VCLGRLNYLWKQFKAQIRALEAKNDFKKWGVQIMWCPVFGMKYYVVHLCIQSSYYDNNRRIQHKLQVTRWVSRMIPFSVISRPTRKRGLTTLRSIHCCVQKEFNQLLSHMLLFTHMGDDWRWAQLPVRSCTSMTVGLCLIGSWSSISSVLGVWQWGTTPWAESNE